MSYHIDNIRRLRGDVLPHLCLKDTGVDRCGSLLLFSKLYVAYRDAQMHWSSSVILCRLRTLQVLFAVPGCPILTEDNHRRMPTLQ